MKLQTFVNKMAAENTYLLTQEAQDSKDEKQARQILIDPGADLSYLPNLKHPLAVLLTHAHFDHIWGLEALLKIFPQLPVYVAEAEKDWSHRPELNASRLLLKRDLIGPDPTDFYDFGKTYQLASFNFKVRPTPGHSIGGVSLIFPDDALVFTGDSLFKHSIGRTDLPTGDYDQLIKSIETELFSLPEAYKIYPGHGPVSYIREEKMSNPFFHHLQ